MSRKGEKKKGCGANSGRRTAQLEYKEFCSTCRKTTLHKDGKCVFCGCEK